MVHHRDSKWSTWLHSPPFPVPHRLSQLQQSFLQESETENTYKLDQLATEMPEVFSSAYRTFQKNSTLKGGGEWEAWQENERKLLGFFISQLRSCDEVFAHVSMHVHRGVTERLCEGVTGGGNRRMCRETPRQTDSWPGRQKKIKDRGTNDWSGWKLFGQAYTTCSLQNHYW